jgi:hypothetical protein
MGMTIDWLNWGKDVVAAIGVSFVALAPTVLPYLSKKKQAREAYQRQLVLELMSDIEILYHAEARYLEMIKDLTGSNMKHRIRQEVEIDKRGLKRLFR